jgi:hypothetical protein
MRNQSAAAGSLVVGALAMVVTMAVHPTGHDFAGGPQQMAHAARVNIGAHALGLVSVPFTLFGLLGLSRWLGFRRNSVSAAFLLFALASVAVMSAALVNGIVAPALFQVLPGADAADRSIFQALLRYNSLVNQAYAIFDVVASSVAIIFWSLGLPKTPAPAQAARVVGIAIGAATVVALLSGHLRLDVHGFGLVVLTQSLWIALVAAMLWRAPEDSGEDALPRGFPAATA